MRRSSQLALWGLAAAAGALLLVWGYPRAAPFQPRHWRVSGTQAEALVLDHLRQLGQPVARPYVITRFSQSSLLERRLQLALARQDLRQLRATGLPDQVTVWEILVYPPDAVKSDYTAKAEVALAGGLLSLQLHVDAEAKGAELTPAAARAQAEALLHSQGIDLRRYGEPEIRSEQLAARTDLALRYRDHLRLADGTAFGMEVKFAGDRLVEFGPWIDGGSTQRTAQRSLQAAQLAIFGQFGFMFGFLAIIAVPFLKRYHEGEVGVRRGATLFVVIGLAGMAYLLMIARAAAQHGPGFSFATPQQSTWLFFLVAALFNVVPLALIVFLGWAVGEWLCRERWGQKLTSFDALFQRKWANATVAASSLGGLLAGVTLAGLLVALLLALQRLGAWPQFAVVHPMSSAWTGIEVATGEIVFAVPVGLALALCVLPALARWSNRPLGFLATALVAAAAMFSPVMVLPFGWGLLVAVVYAAPCSACFWRSICWRRCSRPRSRATCC